MTPLELSFKDSDHPFALELNSFLPSLGIPTPVPAAGIPSALKPPFVHKGFVVVYPSCGIPDFTLFWCAHAKTSSRTDGFYEFSTRKGQQCPLGWSQPKRPLETNCLTTTNQRPVTVRKVRSLMTALSPHFFFNPRQLLAQIPLQFLLHLNQALSCHYHVSAFV